MPSGPVSVLMWLGLFAFRTYACLMCLGASSTLPTNANLAVSHTRHHWLGGGRPKRQATRTYNRSIQHAVIPILDVAALTKTTK